MLHIAEVRCLMGDRPAGLVALDDFVCALSVYAGVLPCYFEDPTGATVGEDNPALSKECSDRMCGEIFLSYYEHESEAADVEIAALRHHADEVRVLCTP